MRNPYLTESPICLFSSTCPTGNHIQTSEISHQLPSDKRKKKSPSNFPQGHRTNFRSLELFILCHFFPNCYTYKYIQFDEHLFSCCSAKLCRPTDQWSKQSCLMRKEKKKWRQMFANEQTHTHWTKSKLHSRCTKHSTRKYATLEFLKQFSVLQ